MEKLDFILALYSSISNRDGSPDLSTLTQDAVNFYRKSIQPIHSCLGNHFDNDNALFLEKYPKMPYSLPILIDFSKNVLLVNETNQLAFGKK